MGEKVLWGRINGLSTKTGECFASNEWLGDQLGYAERTVEAYVSSLVNRGYLTRTYGPSGKRDRRLVPIPTQIGKGLPIPAPVGSHPCPSRASSLPESGSSSVSSRESIREEYSSSAKPRERSQKEVIASEFSAWWSGEDGEPGYPRRVNRKKSEEKYVAARKNGATKEELAIGKRHYSQACRLEATEERFIAHAATWLGQERWKDYQQPPKPVDRKSANGDKASTDEAGDEMLAQYKRCLSAARSAATEIGLERQRDVLTPEDRQKIAGLQAAQQRHEERAADIKARLEARGVVVDEKERVR